MKSHSAMAFIISVTLYVILLSSGYWLFTLTTNTPKEVEVHVSIVPVTLNMFQAAAPQAKPPAPVTEPKPEPEPEPVKQPEPPVEKPDLPKPEPVQPTPPKIQPPKPPLPKIIEPKMIKPKVIEPKMIEPKVIDSKAVEAPLTKEIHEKPIIQEKPDIPNPTPESAAVPTAKKTITPKYSSEQTASAEQAYLYELRNQIAQHAHNTYPTRAKRRHWEGTVFIQFTLLKNGRITHLKIIESSGRQILDDAATTILQAKMHNQFKPFPEEIQRSEWQIQVPVGYHLE